MQLSGLDIVFIIIIAFTSIRAALRGFVRELLTIVALFGGLLIAALFSGFVAGYIATRLGESAWNQIIAFLGLFVVVYLSARIFQNTLQRLIERVHLEGLDRALGLLVGLLEGLVIVVGLLLIVQVQPLVPAERVVGSSQFARLLRPLLPYIDGLLGRVGTSPNV